MTEKLKPCPFCGKDVAEISNLQECESCGNFENEEECPLCYEMEEAEVDEENHPCPRFIICPCYKGGCGASTGWHRTIPELVRAWNTRAGE